MRASGALSAICYREDIEAALRTPGMGGFQLLDIQDFPGQGTALVGMLNVFMESKGLIEPEAWRQFCCETVPLLRMKKYTWTTDETFIGRVQVAHYGAADLPDARVTVDRHRQQGRRRCRAARFDRLTIKQGKVYRGRRFSLPLAGIAAPQKLTHHRWRSREPSIATAIRLWVYPPKVDTTRAAGRDGHRQFLADGDAKAPRRRRQGPAVSQAGQTAAQRRGRVPDRLLVADVCRGGQEAGRQSAAGHPGHPL